MGAEDVSPKMPENTSVEGAPLCFLGTSTSFSSAGATGAGDAGAAGTAETGAGDSCGFGVGAGRFL